MSEPIAYLNGCLLPRNQLSISIFDTGFILGVTATEQIRTFRGVPFCLTEHIARLFQSLEILNINTNQKPQEIESITQQLVEKNYPLLPEGSDLGIGIFVTPGTYNRFSEGESSSPVVCIYTYELAFDQWADQYRQGVTLSIPAIRQVSEQSWPRQLKCRSRVHYYLADQQADEIDSGSRALLLDQQGFVTEATTASVLIFHDGLGIISPPKEKVLPGISVSVVEEIASDLELPFLYKDLLPQEVISANEVLLCGTSPSILPVVRIDKQKIADGKPGPIYQKLLSKWNDRVGLNIVKQAEQQATVMSS